MVLQVIQILGGIIYRRHDGHSEQIPKVSASAASSGAKFNGTAVLALKFILVVAEELQVANIIQHKPIVHLMLLMMIAMMVAKVLVMMAMLMMMMMLGWTTTMLMRTTLHLPAELAHFLGKMLQRPNPQLERLVKQRFCPLRFSRV